VALSLVAIPTYLFNVGGIDILGPKPFAFAILLQFLFDPQSNGIRFRSVAVDL
jgi:hypothetical protein